MESRTGAAEAAGVAGVAKAHTALQGSPYLGHQPHRGVLGRCRGLNVVPFHRREKCPIHEVTNV